MHESALIQCLDEMGQGNDIRLQAIDVGILLQKLKKALVEHPNYQQLVQKLLFLAMLPISAQIN